MQPRVKRASTRGVGLRRRRAFLSVAAQAAKQLLPQCQEPPCEIVVSREGKPLAALVGFVMDALDRLEGSQPETALPPARGFLPWQGLDGRPLCEPPVTL